MYYLDVLDQFDLNGVHLIGHSLGGWIAAELAIRNCSRLASLTLIAPAGTRVKGVPSGDNFIWDPEESVRNLFHDQRFADRILSHTETDEEADLALNSRFMDRAAWMGATLGRSSAEELAASHPSADPRSLGRERQTASEKLRLDLARQHPR